MESSRSDWEPLFWKVFAASRNPMAIVDADRLAVSANTPMQRLLGVSEEELAGQPIEEWLHATDRGQVADRWQAMLARGGGAGVQSLLPAHGEPVTASYATHVAHVGGRLVVLVVLMLSADGAELDGVGHPAGGAAALTPREREIVGFLAMGATSREIAEDLHITPETVRTHVRNAMEKTRTRTRAHLVAAAICRGLLPAISSS